MAFPPLVVFAPVAMEDQPVGVELDLLALEKPEVVPPGRADKEQRLQDGRSLLQAGPLGHLRSQPVLQEPFEELLGHTLTLLDRLGELLLAAIDDLPDEAVSGQGDDALGLVEAVDGRDDAVEGGARLHPVRLRGDVDGDRSRLSWHGAAACGLTPGLQSIDLPAVLLERGLGSVRPLQDYQLLRLRLVIAFR